MVSCPLAGRIGTQIKLVYGRGVFWETRYRTNCRPLSTSLELGSEISSSEESSRSLLIVSLNSGQKPCKGTKIAKGELRLGTWVTILEHGSLRWRHWGCK